METQLTDDLKANPSLGLELARRRSSAPAPASVMKGHTPALCLALLLGAAWSSAAPAEPGWVMVEAQAKPGARWTAQPTRSLSALPAAVPPCDPGALSPYGGWRARQVKATGFFYATRLQNRWWLVDPQGCLFLHKGVASVSELRGPGPQAARQALFGSQTNWAARTAELLHTNGFNGLGAWSNTELLGQAPDRLAYTRLWNFMGTYGQKRGGTYQLPGHRGYPKDCIFVFDPEFESFCDSYARQLAQSKDEPWLLGHFSDNELPLKREALTNYLQLPPADPGYQAALTWLRARHGQAASDKDVTAQDKEEFLGFVTARYLHLVSAAIKKYDPNHLFLGPRLHGSALGCPEVFKAAGPYVDVVAVNLYGTWTPSREKLVLWSGQSGRPVLISEWYAKGVDSGLGNTSGAGWLVRTQADRGLFYQHFTLSLLESQVCVGWHWFKYADNDPAEPGTDPSNRDSNKGIVSARYQPYAPLLQAMQALNQRAYSLADYFDQLPRR